MANTRIIERLLITLGLDVRPYEQGQDRAKKELGKTRKVVNEASESMGKAVAGAARQFAIAFLGFSTASGLVKMLAGLNEATRQLGLMARNTDTTAAELRNWSNAAAVAGGTAEGLLTTIQKIQQEQSNFLTTGQSEWAGYLNALGTAGKKIPLINDDGTMRDKFAVLKDLSAAFELITKQQGRARANSLGLGMGIDQGTMNFLLEGPAAIEKLIQQQQRLPQLTDEVTERSAKLSAQWEMMKQRGVALATVLLANLQPALEGVFEWFNKFGTDTTDESIQAITMAVSALGAALRLVGDVLKIVIEGWGYIIDGIKELWKMMPQGVKNAGAWVWDKLKQGRQWVGDRANAGDGITVNPRAADRRPRGIRNNNPGNLRAVGNQRADKDGFRIFPTMAEGISAARAQLDRYAARGINTIEGIVGTWAPSNENDTEAYIRAVSRATGTARGAQLTRADRERVMNAIFRQEGNGAALGSLQANPGALAAARGAGAPAAALAGASSRQAGSVVNQTTIERIEVNTAATDAEGIAAELPRAIQRRLDIAQAETGLR